LPQIPSPQTATASPSASAWPKPTRVITTCTPGWTLPTARSTAPSAGAAIASKPVTARRHRRSATSTAPPEGKPLAELLPELLVYVYNFGGVPASTWIGRTLGH